MTLNQIIESFCAFVFLSKMEGDNSTPLAPRKIFERSKGGDAKLRHKILSSVVIVSMLVLYTIV